MESLKFLKLISIHLPQGPLTDVSYKYIISAYVLNSFTNFLGYTQTDVGVQIGKLYGMDFSQTTISRFEVLNLSFTNMCKLKPFLQKWLDDADNAQNNLVPLTNPPTFQDTSRKSRKKRVKFQPTVLSSLEQNFLLNSKPSREEIFDLSNELHLEIDEVRVWFQNR